MKNSIFAKLFNMLPTCGKETAGLVQRMHETAIRHNKRSRSWVKSNCPTIRHIRSRRERCWGQ